jgi:hypothetical protein
MHLIIEENNEIIKTLNEQLMQDYCQNIVAEIPKELKKTIVTVDNKIKDVELKKHQLKV